MTLFQIGIIMLVLVFFIPATGWMLFNIMKLFKILFAELHDEFKNKQWTEFMQSLWILCVVISVLTVSIGGIVNIVDYLNSRRNITEQGR